MTSAKKFIKILKVVLQHPGWRQTAICKITKLNKADVSRLCALGVQEGIFQKKENGYYEGEILESSKEALLHLLKED